VLWMDKSPAVKSAIGPEEVGKDSQEAVAMVDKSSIQKSGISWKHTEISAFYAAFITPHIRIMDTSAVIAIREILTILDDFGGDCPSIVQGDEETPPQYHALTSTLREHSLDVTREAYDILKKSDNILLMAKIFVATLGHDLGKIPNKNNGGERVNLHAFKSAGMLETIIKDLEYRENVLTAVKSHHLSQPEVERMNNATLFILRQADWEARRKEINRPAVLSKPLDQRQKTAPVPTKPSPVQGKIFQLTTENLIRIIEPLININNIDSVFSFKDTVYVQPAWLQGTVAMQAKSIGDENTVSLCIGADSNEKMANLIAEKLETRALEYRVHFIESVKKPVLPKNVQYYTLKLDLFGDPEGIEERRKRNSLLRSIKSIE